MHCTYVDEMKALHYKQTQEKRVILDAEEKNLLVLKTYEKRMRSIRTQKTQDFV